MRRTPCLVSGVPDHNAGGKHLPVMSKTIKPVLACCVPAVRFKMNDHAAPGESIREALGVSGELVAMPLVRITRLDVDQILARSNRAKSVEGAAVAEL